MLESPFVLSNYCSGINKIDKSDVLNCLSSSASSPTAKVFTTRTNTIIKQACSYQAEKVLNRLSKQELLWWVEHLKLNNGRPLRQK